MTEEQIRIFNVVLSGMINTQKNLKQPIYVIASFWCGRFNGIETTFTEDGNNDLEEIKKLFNEKYVWKPGQFGVTEQSYALIKIDLTVINCEQEKGTPKNYCLDSNNDECCPSCRKKLPFIPMKYCCFCGQKIGGWKD